MDELVSLLFFAFFLLTIVTLVGHGIWVVLAWFGRELFGRSRTSQAQDLSLSPPKTTECVNCHALLASGARFCGVCAASQPSAGGEESLQELHGTLRTLERLHEAGAIDQVNFRVLRIKIEDECDRIIFPHGRPTATAQPSLFDRVPSRQTTFESTRAETPPPSPTIPPLFASTTAQETSFDQVAPQLGAWAADSSEAVIEPPILKPPRKPFAEVLASFMEESNIRWGEIVGGLLIVGCSTALVISLWAQISRIPVLKFFIFTTVTAALFGIGFYTAHRWKLPTTSRGILTIATLLVPLNFLAIAAVSSSEAPSNIVVIGSELAAPAIFLCLVYFAGRVITSSWPHLLAAGVLASSAGQLLIRHIAAPENSPPVLFGLGAFPILCYVAAIAWMLRRLLADDEIAEAEANQIFLTLGASTFAAALPFGLLLYRSGPVGMSMMYLAPLVTLGGMPVLASGALLWRKIKRKELVNARTAGTSLAIVGAVIVLAGMGLAWPNPATIVPAALLNFAAFTTIAILLDLPLAHVLAASCLAFAYVIAFQVITGRVQWQNLRVTSLLDVTIDISTGQALTFPFVMFTLTTEWLRRKGRVSDAVSYLVAACGVAIVSLLLITLYALGQTGDPHLASFIFALYAAGAFWFASRERSVVFTWVAAALVFVASVQACASLLSLTFPWQASFLLFSTVAASAALTARGFDDSDREKLFVSPLETSAIAVASVAALLLLVDTTTNGFEPVRLLAWRAFWLTGICFALLTLSRARVFFTAFQVSLVLVAALSTKGFLQRFDWYGYQPNAWLHPWALEIQGVVLGLICLGWIVSRMVARRNVDTSASEMGEVNATDWLSGLRQGLRMPIAFDHLLAGALVIGLAALAVFGTLTGISTELTRSGRTAVTYSLAGFQNGLIFGVGSWFLLVILLLTMLGNFRVHRHALFALGAFITCWIICPLLAGRFESQVATASAARWAVAIFLLVVSIGFSLRKKLFGIDGPRSSLAIVLLLFITLTPLMLITLSVIVDDINYVPGRGPQGIFLSMGPVALYGLPLMLAAAALSIHAVTERSPAFMFAAGLLVNLTVTTVQVVSIAAHGGLMTRRVLEDSLQLNAITAAAVALVWLGTRNYWITTVVPAQAERLLLTWEKLIAIGFAALFIIPILLHLIALPDRLGQATFAAGSFNGWIALLLTISVVILLAKLHNRPLSAPALATSLLAAGSLSAFGIGQFGVAKWAGLHVLIGAWVVSAWLVLLARDLGTNKIVARWNSRLGLSMADDWKWDSDLSATVTGAIVVLIALRGPFMDPLGAWWSIGALITMSGLAASLNWLTFKRAYLYAAGILLNAALSIWVIKYQSQQVSSGRAFVEANIIALCLAGVVSLWLELRARRLVPQLNSKTASSFHNFAALLSLLSMGFVVAIDIKEDLGGFYSVVTSVLDWLALLSLITLMAASLWDQTAKYAVAGLYLAGLLGAGTFLHQLGFSPRHLIWALTMAGGIHALIAALIWRERRRVMLWATTLKIPSRIDPDLNELQWLNVCNSIVPATIVMFTFWIDLKFAQWPLRATASLGVIAQALTFGLMAQGERRQRWQRSAISMLLAGAVLFGWSFLVPGITGTWLNRAVILMTVMFAGVALFGAELDKLIEREPDWTKVFRDCVPVMTVVGILSLAFVLGTEIYYRFAFGAVRMNFLALATVAITLGGGTAVCILFALSPKHVPLGLSENRRRGYVYAAEAMLVLLFMHIRLTMPWLFTGFFARYWPLAVVTIAYAGVAVSELLRRRRLLILAEPIERTGALLPMLPVIGFWIVASRIEYSTLLFFVGGLYAVLSILRSSFMFGLLAAVAGNGGLWYLLHHTSEYRFWQHPQLWLIPVAVSVLIAAHLNRRDFSDSQMAGIRYLVLVTIYVSSTADIFINGVAQSPWLPLILAGLSLTGVFAGMVFRIRAFLLLGSMFLLLAIVTMINYASVNFGWTWLWYVAGIITGALIIATFAVFEKKRAEVLRVVDGLRDWQK